MRHTEHPSGRAPDSHGAIPNNVPANNEGEIDESYAKFLGDPERKFEAPRSGNYAWWQDPNREPLFRRFPRAVTIRSVNTANGTALVAYFADGFSRKTEQTLVQISDLRRREIYY